jgi:uncharacterized protein (TIRG00374 family)
MIGFVASLVLGLAGVAVLQAQGLLDPRLNHLGQVGAAMLLVTLLLFAISLSDRFRDVTFSVLPAGVTRSRLGEVVQRFHRTYARFRTHRGALAAFTILTLLEQLVTVLYTWCTARAVGVHVDLVFMAGVLSLTLLVSRLPISFDGLGVFEMVFIVLMALAGVSPAQALSVALIGRVVQTLAWLPWCLAYGVERHRPARDLALSR